MTVLSALVSVLVLAQACAFAAIAPRRASTFAGVTSSAVFPPPGAAITAAGTLFQDGSQVGFPGPTATGDEAAAIQTAPAVAIVDSIFPLIQPNPLGGPTKENGKPFNILDHVGQLSPWQSVDSFGLPKASAKVPNGCSLSQVHLLHRHGARYPTGDSAVASFAAKVHSTASTTGFTATGPASFLNTWKYKLGSEILTPFGRSQLFNLGVGFRIKYGELLKGFQDLPVFRTTSEARMLDSALHFAAGFFGVQDYQSQYHQLITIENDGQNNTLSPFDNCANANNVINAFGNVQTNKWVNIYLQPALKRIGAEMKGFNLTLGDLTIMQQLCAYETVALGFSEFCDLFTKEEWEGFEYSIDLNFWYANGPGNPAASAQGIGYVQELVARLTQKPITTFDSAVNKSIVTNKALFPLNQPIFVDATHDTVLSIILTAMNFTSLAATGPLPTDHIPENRSYNINHIAPFGTNLVGQVLSCPASKEPTHIRWILNDAVLPLTGVHGCKANSDGLCDLKTYIAAMQQRIKEVDFNFDCFGNYTIPQPDKIIDGRFPKNLRK